MRPAFPLVFISAILIILASLNLQGLAGPGGKFTVPSAPLTAPSFTVEETNYAPGPGGIAFSSSGSETRFYHQDRMGSTKAMSKADGTAVYSADYQPFGQPFNEQGQASYKFTGKEEDSTGLDYFGARYYDADTGRFSQTDPINNPSVSPYMYASSNPLRFKDPDGRLTFETNMDVKRPTTFSDVKDAWARAFSPQGAFDHGASLNDAISLTIDWATNQDPNGITGVVGGIEEVGGAAASRAAAAAREANIEKEAVEQAKAAAKVIQTSAKEGEIPRKIRNQMQQLKAQLRGANDKRQIKAALDDHGFPHRDNEKGHVEVLDQNNNVISVFSGTPSDKRRGYMNSASDLLRWLRQGENYKILE